MSKPTINFQLVASKVFAKLLESFPNPIDLDATVAGFEAKAGYQKIKREGEKPGWLEGSEYIYPEADEVLFTNTVRWLEAEGYLRFEKVRDCRFASVTLSEKGLRNLSAMPPCLT